MWISVIIAVCVVSCNMTLQLRLQTTVQPIHTHIISHCIQRYMHYIKFHTYFRAARYWENVICNICWIMQILCVTCDIWIDIDIVKDQLKFSVHKHKHKHKVLEYLPLFRTRAKSKLTKDWTWAKPRSTGKSIPKQVLTKSSLNSLIQVSDSLAQCECQNEDHAITAILAAVKRISRLFLHLQYIVQPRCAYSTYTCILT